MTLRTIIQEKLEVARQKYPYRVLRQHSMWPRPENIERIYQPFARYPDSKGDDEWLFENESARNLFQSVYGGRKV